MYNGIITSFSVSESILNSVVLQFHHLTDDIILIYICLLIKNSQTTKPIGIKYALSTVFKGKAPFTESLTALCVAVRTPLNHMKLYEILHIIGILNAFAYNEQIFLHCLGTASL